MKPIHAFSLATVVLALALLLAGFASAAGIALAIGTAGELVHAGWTGKKSN